jgi:hypothetical protein
MNHSMNTAGQSAIPNRAKALYIAQASKSEQNPFQEAIDLFDAMSS